MGKRARPNLHGIKKILGLLHVPSGEIFIDHSQHKHKKTFIKLHKAEHSFLPHQKKLYEVMEDGKIELDPETEDLFEREANNFASEVLFQLDLYEKIAADYEISIKTPVDLSKKFGGSMYASIRRYVQTHFSRLALGIYEKTITVGGENIFRLRREPIYSQSFNERFGYIKFPNPCPEDSYFYNILTSTKFQEDYYCNVEDLNKNIYSALLNILNNSYQIFILVIPIKKVKVIDSNIFFNVN